jgi:hypothetical protein
MKRPVGFSSVIAREIVSPSPSPASSAMATAPWRTVLQEPEPSLRDEMANGRARSMPFCIDPVMPTDLKEKRPVELTHRDLAIFRLVGANRAVPRDLVAGQLFAVDPVTGQQNRNPLRACDRRLQILAAAGYLWLTQFHDAGRSRTVVMLGPAAAGVTGSRPALNRIPPRKRAHHMKTLDALALIASDVTARGGRVTRTRLEADLRREQQVGRFTQKNDSLDECPDAAVTIETGEPHLTREIAVEYVTSKYTDKDIAAKYAGFGRNYDGVMWFADRPRTAERVQRITGMPCTTLK